ncbi:Hypothetical predicted protein [Paramuricea clavata]|uniref:Endonuclease/exonuclease/phosphatase domain-containing protein n=1 Tax=Paramuricea clavata TaxID=317549 RepID=A0A7D9EEE3_PARCT|nr:Hypothetical predicted protein [Paramuricea clavata]
MSETWLKENNLLLQHVTIPGYVHAFNNRDKIRGGGVGIYIKESIKFKRRQDLEKRYPTMEHLWIEIPGRNRYSKLLLGTIYRSDAILPYTTWLEYFNDLLSDLSIQWDGMLAVTGDFNVDLLRPDKADTKKYNDVLESMNLDQLVTKPTRTTPHSATLIDHVITNMKQQVSHCDVLPSPFISDHDAPYFCLNVRVPRFVPRFKMIRNERNFNIDSFTKSFNEIPLSLVYAVDDPDSQPNFKRTAMLSVKCLVKTTPMKSPNRRYRDVRNKLKTKIKSAKRDFYQRAFSSKNPKKVWKIIHRILHPNPKPLRIDPDELNTHFASATERVTGAIPEPTQNLWSFINSLPDDSTNAFHLREVSYQKVLNEIKNLRSDCSCGPDGIPVKYIKMIAEQLASPLTHIINNCISKQLFPSPWKIARICAIPKVQNISSNNDLRPISILPSLTKIFERLVLRQMSDFVTNTTTGVLNQSISAYRKGHNTTTVMLAMRDDIQRAMKR